MSRFTFLFSFLVLFVLQATAQTTLVPFGSEWKYLDNGSNQGTAWRSTSFSDLTWKTGSGKFGYGISDATTVVSYGPNAKKKYITTYFRKSITIASASAYTSYTGEVKRDDGVVVYVNGVEVYRNNMPTGTITYTTTATDAKDNGTVAQSFTIPASAFTSGTNVIAVEVHQQRANTPDMAFDLQLIAGSAPPPVNQLPTVSISSPAQGASFAVGQPITVAATASDPEGSLAQVEFFASGTSLGKDLTSPYSVSWTPATTGSYTLTARATDAAGASTTSTGVSVTITAAPPVDPTPPTVISINRQNPTTSTTTSTTVFFRATFSEQVIGVDAADFTATTVSGTVKGTVTNVVSVSSTIYDITVSSITGEGTLRLDLKSSGTGITDIIGNAIQGGYTSGQSYTIQQTLPPTDPKILYYEGFESGTAFAGMHIQSSTSYGLMVVDKPTYSGVKVGRWELRAGDPPAANGTRTEVLFTAELAQQETWHSYAGYFPSVDYLIDTYPEVFNQWHQGISGSPMLTFRTVNDRFAFYRVGVGGAPSISYDLGPLVKDQWVEIIIHIKQHLTDGIVQIWINGDLKLNIQGGATMFEGPYGRWKMGIYKWKWNDGGTTNTTKRVWYVDEVKIGNAASTRETMEPIGNNISILSEQISTGKNIMLNDQNMEKDQIQLLKVYPTIAKRGTVITVRTEEQETAEAFVTDIACRTVHTISRINGTFFINTADLPTGMYFVNLLGDKQLSKRKFIVTD
ncbi:heparin lyase I family protein [Pontibacter ruber]|uniref:Heparin lyase I family protein n=1 Tax=Pontibacter ruber TaxID=1343895 RepID=A0ABW5D0X2_9BACT|nr:heparin lyase I family protein [Pontibacter ruber]